MAKAQPLPKKNIIILGSSYAALSTAHHLLRHTFPHLPEPHTYRVLVISAAGSTFCRPACPRACLSDAFFAQEKLFVDVREQLVQYESEAWDFVLGRVEKVDEEGREVHVTCKIKPEVNAGADGGASGTEEEREETFKYHALVIATGASTPSPLLGLSPTADTHALRHAWSLFRPALSTASHIVIAGGGPAGVELAGELGEYLNGAAPGWFRSTGTEPKVKITLVTGGDRILPALRPAIAATAVSHLTKLGVQVMPNTRVESTTPANAGTTLSTLTAPTTLLLSNETTLQADIYIPATGTHPNTSFLPPSLLTPSMHIPTSPTALRCPSLGPLVYALGDASDFARPAIHNIIAAVPVLAGNIKHDLLLDAGVPEAELSPEKVFTEDKRETQLVPIGRNKGVGAAMGWRMPSWVVWAIKGRDYWVWTTGKLWSGRQWGNEG